MPARTRNLASRLARRLRDRWLRLRRLRQLRICRRRLLAGWLLPIRLRRVLHHLRLLGHRRRLLGGSLRRLRSLGRLLRRLLGRRRLLRAFLILRLRLATLLRTLLRRRLRLLRGLCRLLRLGRRFARLLRSLLRTLRHLLRLPLLLRGLLRGLHRLLRALGRLLGLGTRLTPLIRRRRVARRLRRLHRAVRRLLRALRGLHGLLRGLGGLLRRLLRALRRTRIGRCVHLLRHGILLPARLLQLLGRTLQRVLRNRAQLLRHLRILSQRLLELREHLRRRLLRHLRELLRLGKLLVEFRLDPVFLLGRAERRARLVGLALLQIVVVLRELVQRVGQLLLLVRRLRQRLLLRRRQLALHRACEVFRGAGRRLPEHRQRIVRIARPLAGVLVHHILRIRIGADRILQRIDLFIQLLLRGERVLRLRPGLGRLLVVHLVGLLHGLLFQFLRLLRELRHHLLERRRHLREFLARLVHRLPQKIERLPHHRRQRHGVLRCALWRTLRLEALLHLLIRPHRRRVRHRLPDDLLHLVGDRLDFLSRQRLAEQLRQHTHPSLDPFPIMRIRRARPWVENLPLLHRREMIQPLIHLRHVMPAFEQPEIPFERRERLRRLLR